MFKKLFKKQIEKRLLKEKATAYRRSIDDTLTIINDIDSKLSGIDDKNEIRSLRLEREILLENVFNMCDKVFEIDEKLKRL